MIRPINFTGIKNVGYTRVIIDHNPNIEEKTIMNMELTDDGKNQDLAEYRKFLKSNPSLKNEINDRFINIEFDSFTVGDGFGTKMGINGNDIFPSGENMNIINFAKNLVNRVAKFKNKDYVKDEYHYLSKEAQEGLIYKKNIEDYVDGSSGRLDLLEGSGLTEKFAHFFNDQEVKLTDAQEEKLFAAIDNIVDVLHEPAYVHNGAMYMSALFKGYKNSNLLS